MFQHRIEDRQQCAHARREGNLLGFSGCTQAPIEGLNHRVAPRVD